jgi:hypothetical protein
MWRGAPQQISNLPGLDPNDNMNYVPDVCMNKFTAEQRLVMRAAWFTYRAKAPVAPPVAPTLARGSLVLVEIGSIHK